MRMRTLLHLKYFETKIYFHQYMRHQHINDQSCHTILVHGDEKKKRKKKKKKRKMIPSYKLGHLSNRTLEFFLI